MTNLTDLSSLTTRQLNRIIAIKQEIEKLQSQIAAIADGGEIPSPFAEDALAPAKRKYHMTAAHKRKLIKALVRARRIRWAKASKPAKKGKRRLSAAGRAAIIAATKARWAKVKAAKKKDRRSSPAVRATLAAAARARWTKVKAAGKTTL
jgi:hypothetical protein